MPNQMLKGTVKYCLGNKLFFTFVFVQFLLFECITNTVGGLLKSTSLIVLLAVLGYGLKVAQDVMNGGSSFPKINLNEFINFGLKGIVIYTFYLTIQASILGLLSIVLNFPEFDLEELIVHLPETVELFYQHDPLSFIFFILGNTNYRNNFSVFCFTFSKLFLNNLINYLFIYYKLGKELFLIKLH